MRCLVTSSIPSSTDWYGLLSLHIESQRVLLPNDFLQRLNLTAKVDSAIKKKAEQESSERKLRREALDELVSGLRTTFCDRARNYLLFLLEGSRRHVTMTTSNVRGMACFDPQVMLSMSLEFAGRCFTDLYRGFCLRGWFEPGSEQTYRDDYLAFLVDLRQSGITFASSSSIIHDIVTYLTDLQILRSRPRIYHLFKLSCLCLTDVAPDLPAVTFGSVDSSRMDCRQSAVIKPVQSFIMNVPGSVGICTEDSALDSFFK